MASHQRPDTTFSDDGRTAFIRIAVERRDYEFARQWAAFHAGASPSGTAEDQLEGYLNMALMEHIRDMGWTPPPEIEALFPEPEPVGPDDMNDGIPF